MERTGNNKIGIWVGSILSALIVIGAIVLSLAVIAHTNYYPQTDDSEILANFIGIAPQVEGPLIHLNVRDNRFVKKGDLSTAAKKESGNTTLQAILAGRSFVG